MRIEPQTSGLGHQISGHIVRTLSRSSRREVRRDELANHQSSGWEAAHCELPAECELGKGTTSVVPKSGYRASGLQPLRRAVAFRGSLRSKVLSFYSGFPPFFALEFEFNFLCLAASS